MKVSIALLLALLLPMSNGVEEPSIKELLQRTYPVYRLAATSLRLFNSSQLTTESCPQQLERFRSGVDDRAFWALKILDASGVPSPGFVYGNNYWLGVRSQCVDLRDQDPIEINAEIRKNDSLYRDATQEFPPYDLHYFVAYFRHTSTLQYHIRWENEDLITLGLCLPASCTVNELDVILKAMFQEGNLMFGDLYSANLQLVQIKDLKDDQRWLLSANNIITLLVMALFVLLLILGTLYEIFQDKHSEVIKEVTIETGNCENNNIKENGDPDKIKSHKREEERWKEILLCFSIRKNTSLIFSTVEGSDSVKPIHGLRFLGMVWVVFIHTIFYMIDFNDNHLWTWKFTGNFVLQIISNSTFVVDSFFFLSGFLVAYAFFVKQKVDEKTSGQKMISNFFLAVFRRFIRLTPAYMMVLGIVQLNGAWYERTSQFEMVEHPENQCAKYWWRNLLYINNFFSRESMCMSWSWYLSNDMQFFIIAYFLLFLSTICFYVAATILFLLLFFSIAITGYIVYVNNYIPTLDEQYNMLDVLYDPPWTRIGPYIVGMITGYIITWVPLSRLTYCAYLLNPFIISSMYLQKESTIHMEIFAFIPLILGTLVMNFISAYILSVALESPTVLLMRKFIDKKRR